MLKVPLAKQQRLKSCGPCALLMALAAQGISVSESDLIKKVGGIRPYGVRAADLAKTARKIGHRVTCLSWNPQKSKNQARFGIPDKQQILKELRRNNPVILTVRAAALYRRKTRTKGHFIVVTGYHRGRFHYNDPYDGKRHTIKENELLFCWMANALDSSAYLVAIGKHV